MSAGNRIETLALTTVEQQQPQAVVDGDAELAPPQQIYKFNRTCEKLPMGEWMVG